MTDDLTLDALACIDDGLAALDRRSRSALLGQIIAVASGQLAAAEGGEHTSGVLARIAQALDHPSGSNRGAR